MLEDFDVMAPADPAVAIARIRRAKVHLILLDLELTTPKIDALTLLHRIRELDDDVELVVIPGAASIETVSRAIQYRLGGSMPLPSTRARLHEIVACIARRRPLSVPAR